MGALENTGFTASQPNSLEDRPHVEVLFSEVEWNHHCRPCSLLVASLVWLGRPEVQGVQGGSEETSAVSGENPVIEYSMWCVACGVSTTHDRPSKEWEDRIFHSDFKNVAHVFFWLAHQVVLLSRFPRREVQ